MSGTSADGMDLAIVDITGAPPAVSVKLIKHIQIDYAPELRAEIFACFRPESSGVDRLSRLNVALGEAYASAALALIDATNLKPDDIDLISSHGQTLWYDAPTNSSSGTVLTLGEAAVIAERTGITTINHLRSRDLAAGGRGAPLVSFLDWLLFRHSIQGRAIQNIGGIGNVTALPPFSLDAPPFAFDTGPGNMIMDYCANRATGGIQQYDRDGLIAASGRVHETLLAELMKEPYLHMPPPKTTGRELFGVQFGATVWERGEALTMSTPDIVATVTAFTAETIAAAYRAWIPWPVAELYVAGGGALNPTLMAMLRTRIPTARVSAHDELGIPAVAKEAILFALLGYETWHGRSGSLPTFTGAARPVILGSITPGRLWR